MKNKWYQFDGSKGSRQKRPKVRKYVLVKCFSKHPSVMPDLICVGYMKNGAGDKQSPYFVTPGVPNNGAYAWNDCLPDDFEWYNKKEEN